MAAGVWRLEGADYPVTYLMTGGYHSTTVVRCSVRAFPPNAILFVAFFVYIYPFRRLKSLLNGYRDNKDIGNIELSINSIVNVCKMTLTEYCGE